MDIQYTVMDYLDKAGFKSLWIAEYVIENIHSLKYNKYLKMHD